MPPTDQRRPRRRSRAAALGVVAGAVGLWTVVSAWQPGEAIVPVAPAPRFHPQIVTPSVAVPPHRAPVRLELRSGQALGPLLIELGLEPGEAVGAVAALDDYLEVRRLRPGLQVSANLEADSTIAAVEVTLDGEGRVRVSPGDDGGWAAEWRPFDKRVELRRASSVVESSLVGALADADVPEVIAYRMAEVLQWDIDFNRDLRTGDSFEVVFEEVYLDGAYHSSGEVVAVAFTNRGRTVEAFRYGDEGYYDAEGRPLRKMFLRSPLEFSRITSHFTHQRFHPVLKVNRPHYGVDYGAPTGTPVRATASGVVASAGWDGGGGKTVKIRHPNDFLTAYLHLSGYAKGVRSGARVRQGEVIGYVGSTGLATGPHLDYRVQHRGRWIDPLTIERVPAEPIPGERLADFLVWRDALRVSLSAGAPPPALPAQRLAASAPPEPDRRPGK